jgi:hypothetical protein
MNVGGMDHASACMSGAARDGLAHVSRGEGNCISHFFSISLIHHSQVSFFSINPLIDPQIHDQAWHAMLLPRPVGG